MLSGSGDPTGNFYEPVKLKIASTLKLVNQFRVRVGNKVSMLPVVRGSTLQVAISSSCHDTIAPRSVVGRFLLQVRKPGTHCHTISVIHRSAKTLLGDR